MVLLCLRGFFWGWGLDVFSDNNQVMTSMTRAGTTVKLSSLEDMFPSRYVLSKSLPSFYRSDINRNECAVNVLLIF